VSPAALPAGGQAPQPCAITILHAPGRRLAKTITAGAVAGGYDRTRTFNLRSRDVADLAGLADALRDLFPRLDCAVVRGAIADPSRTQRVRRLLHADPETGTAPTLLDVPRSWVALDVDGVPLPAATDPRDLAACAAAVVPLLPPAFAAAACIVQATASHGIKPGARLRLWYWLSRPLTCAECRRWLDSAPVDRSAFNAAQIIYTAAPVALDGRDPLPQRTVFMPGAAAAVPPDADTLAAPPPRQFAAIDSAAPHPTSLYAVRCLQTAAKAIMRAEEGDRHATAVGQAWRLAGLAARGRLAPDAVRVLLGSALLRSGKSVAEGHGIAEWALARQGVAA
jgi:hypothetical protein